MGEPRQENTPDPFRFCVFCGTDCYENESEHAADCPTNTGVYPVREEGPVCIHCGKHALPLPCCMDCGAVLNVGDFYMHREVDPGDPSKGPFEGAAVYEVICVGCKAKEEIAGV